MNPLSEGRSRRREPGLLMDLALGIALGLALTVVLFYVLGWL